MVRLLAVGASANVAVSRPAGRHLAVCRRRSVGSGVGQRRGRLAAARRTAGPRRCHRAGSASPAPRRRIRCRRAGRKWRTGRSRPIRSTSPACRTGRRSASMVIGQNTGRLSTRIDPPACRMALLGCSRTPPIAIASAPAAHRSLTSNWTSRSRITPLVEAFVVVLRCLVEHDSQPGAGDRGDLPGRTPVRRRSAAARPRRAPTGSPAVARPGPRSRWPARIPVARPGRCPPAGRTWSSRRGVRSSSALLADTPNSTPTTTSRRRRPLRRTRPWPNRRPGAAGAAVGLAPGRLGVAGVQMVAAEGFQQRRHRDCGAPSACCSFRPGRRPVGQPPAGRRRSSGDCGRYRGASGQFLMIQPSCRK